MKITPLRDRVFVERIEIADRVGSIIIPDIVKEKPEEGMVLAIGEGIRDDEDNLTPMDLKVGDHILYGKVVGSDIVIDGKKILVLKESDVIGVIES